MIKINRKDVIFGPQINLKGYSKGYADGQKSEYDRFWDAFQDYGNRTNYVNAFSGVYWNADTLRPKYTCKIVNDGGASMFNKCFFSPTAYTKTLDISHISIDVSEATNCEAMFSNALVNKVTLIFSEKVTSLLNAFTKNNQGGATGMEITLKVPNPNCNWTNAFSYHANLKRLILLEGTVIGVNGFSVQWCQYLPQEDIVGIINALSTQTSGLSVAINKRAVDKAFETSSGANDGSTSAKWLALIATKPNWTISLI